MLYIALIVGFFWIVSWFRDKIKPPSSPPASRPNRVPPPPPPPRPATVHRPSRQASPSPIRFNNIDNAIDTGGGETLSQENLDGLRDAFTGAPLDIGLGLYRCSTCQVYYHRESYDVVRSENGGHCVACASTAIVPVHDKTSPGRNFTPDVVTLANFRDHFGHVVTFEGEVKTVRISQRGTDFAVMFERKSWVAGFKPVFFRQAVRKVGGADFINSLQGRRVRVRGLLINHAQFGPEIIISERSMILEIT
ncbi:hypothetical protein SAMN05518849_115146 [Sphingobium sp. AP50]|uniref:hypothetical protein n=1 Tax=Sphingobium sp. AP50 TaxID=1884369 RepID=UPI0008CF73FB|nr:hypothetical protein [Sphingobium sp. AP50]SEJ85317.1 hypothetical protein SAMN05518849_115146 [Sphingobium sp. AP50]